MGTRSLTLFKNTKDSEEIAVIYRQMDGYPESHGKELKDILCGMTIVNGILLDEDRKIANGMNCLAAQVIAALKVDVGNIYLYPVGTRDAGEEYIYTIYPEKVDEFGRGIGRVMLDCFDIYENKSIFSGFIEDFLT